MQFSELGWICSGHFNQMCQARRRPLADADTRAPRRRDFSTDMRYAVFRFLRCMTCPIEWLICYYMILTQSP